MSSREHVYLVSSWRLHSVSLEFLLQSCCDGMASLASFVSQARRIKFYYSLLFVGQRFQCCLEPYNPYDRNCVALVLPGHSMLGHLAREVARLLALLLKAGFQAHGKDFFVYFVKNMGVLI